ncbi:MAG: replication factor C large subunit [archaeon]
MEPWTAKYRPRTLSDVAGNQKAKDMLMAWLETWNKGAPPKKAALLYGPAGTGKTVSAETAAHDLGYDLIEINASDHRNAVSITKIAGSAATQGSIFDRKRLILLDEIDGINLREDSGAISAVIEIIKSTRFPILLTANDVWNPKIRSLRNHCLLVEFKRLGVRDSIPYLESLLKREGVEVDANALRLVYDRNKGDMRSTINDLQTALAGRRTLVLKDVEWLSWRDRQEPIFQSLATVFSSKDCIEARRAVEISDVDYEMLYEWIYENAPAQLTNPIDLSDALDSLARADIYFARVRRFQAWRLLPYAFDMMTAGVATSKLRTRPAWSPMRFPQRIMKLSSTRGLRAMRQSIGAKLGSKAHMSTDKAAKEVLPYLRIIFENNSQMASSIAEWLDLDADMISFIRGTKEEAGTEKKLTQARRTVKKAPRTRRKKVSSV